MEGVERHAIVFLFLSEFGAFSLLENWTLAHLFHSLTKNLIHRLQLFDLVVFPAQNGTFT